MKKRAEAIVIKNRGGKIVEVKLFSSTGGAGDIVLRTDNRMAGAMESRDLSACQDFIDWLDKQGRLQDAEKMILSILS